MLKIIALKNESMHKIGISKLNEIDNDIRILEKTIKEEDTKIDGLKKDIIMTSDVDGSNVVYKNNLNFHSTQSLGAETQRKIKSYLSGHLSNFKPHNEKSQNLIETIKSQNAEIIKKNKLKGQKILQNFEIIKEKEKQLSTQELKQKLNLTILPNLSKDTKIFMDLDVQYDFVPSNEEFLVNMRLDFISKKDKIINFIRECLKTKGQKQIFYRKKFDHDYLKWSKKIAENSKRKDPWHSELKKDGNILKELLEKDSAIPPNDFSAQPVSTTKKSYSSTRGNWMDKKKENMEEEGHERELSVFKECKADLSQANYNQYNREFFEVIPTLKSILDPIRYDYDYKSSDIWTLEDVRNFIIQYLWHPKDFNKITSTFKNKTNKDIVDFYFNFKFHFNLSEAFNRDRYNNFRRSAYPQRETAYKGSGYNSKAQQKKREFIASFADDIIKKITTKYYEQYEKYSQEKFHQPLLQFTSFQLMQIFSNSSAQRRNLHTHRRREQMYEEAKNRGGDD